MNERIKDFLTVHRWQALAAVSIAGVIVVGPKLVNVIDNEFFRSDIVAGVPVQVESRRAAADCEYRVGIGGACVESATYYLQVEQCQQDIEAARKGKHSQSFDLRAGKIGKGCLQDQVRVRREVWQMAQEKTILILPGTLFGKIAK